MAGGKVELVGQGDYARIREARGFDAGGGVGAAWAATETVWVTSFVGMARNAVSDANAVAYGAGLRFYL